MSTSSAGPKRRLYRSRSHRMIAGVCGGLADYFGWDPTVVRLLFILSILLPGPQVILYLAAWVIVPLEPDPEDEETAGTEAPGEG